MDNNFDYKNNKHWIEELYQKSSFVPQLSKEWFLIRSKCATASNYGNMFKKDPNEYKNAIMSTIKEKVHQI